MTAARASRIGWRSTMPHAVRRLVLLDIAPTLAMYEQTTEAFARAYWHWFFLIQPAPLPERLIEADPAAYVRDVMGRRSAGLAPFDPRALAEYERCLRAARHGARHLRGLSRRRRHRPRARPRRPRRRPCAWRCRCWRCGAPTASCTAASSRWREWRRVAADVRGEALPCGHYIAEEAPDALLANGPALPAARATDDRPNPLPQAGRRAHRRGARRAERAAVLRPAPDERVHQPAGLRRPARARPRRADAGPERRRGEPHHPDRTRSSCA